MGRFTLVLLFLLLARTEPALACSYSGPWIDINWRVDYARDGSFRNGGEDDRTVGEAPFDLQGGRIGQVIASSGACWSVEYLLIADCNSLEMTVVDYVPRYPGDEDVIFQGSATVDELLPPDGLLTNVSDKTILEMRRYLIRNGAGDGNDLLRVNREEKPRDQFNPFAGCTVLYPESRGATYKWPKPTE
jgi:hypothetical protein